jgi:hypothetical protein
LVDLIHESGCVHEVWKEVIQDVVRVHHTMRTFLPLLGDVSNYRVITHITGFGAGSANVHSSIFHSTVICSV